MMNSMLRLLGMILMRVRAARAGWMGREQPGRQDGADRDRRPGHQRLGPHQRRSDRPLGPKAIWNPPRCHTRADAPASISALASEDRREETPRGPAGGRRD